LKDWNTGEVLEDIPVLASGIDLQTPDPGRLFRGSFPAARFAGCNTLVLRLHDIFPATFCCLHCDLFVLRYCLQFRAAPQYHQSGEWGLGLSVRWTSTGKSKYLPAAGRWRQRVWGA